MKTKTGVAESLFCRVLSGYSIARSAMFNLESLPLPVIRKLFNLDESVVDSPEFKNRVLSQMESLFEKDSKNIVDGIYPISVLKPGPISSHIKSLFSVWVDAFFVSYRASRNSNKKFKRSAQKLLTNVPEYYRRNFHNQTDGYLSAKSAKIYEHQVDLLFKGSTDAMRRSILPTMVKHLGKKKPIRILELGCGVGSFTRFLKQTFPDSEIKAVDLSKPYLNQAEKHLAGETGVSFIEGDAENLFFKDEYFDAVVSVFLFHELPFDVRKNVVLESKRVLKKGGYLGVVDSIQEDDNILMGQAIEEFPKIFHEPFYKNYLKNPMEDLINSAFEVNACRSEVHFLSKCVYLQKSI